MPLYPAQWNLVNEFEESGRWWFIVVLFNPLISIMRMCVCGLILGGVSISAESRFKTISYNGFFPVFLFECLMVGHSEGVEVKKK